MGFFWKFSTEGDGDPLSCVAYSGSGNCSSSYPNKLKIGKLWEDDTAFGVNHSIRETANAIYNDQAGHPATYNPDKYFLFRDSGIWTRVNY